MKKAMYLQPETRLLVHAIGKKQHRIYMNRPLLLRGNSKVGLVGRFGLMRVTRGIPVHDCPDASESCRQECYALKYLLWNLGKNLDMGEYYSYLAHNKPKELFARLHRDLAALSHYPMPIVVRVHDAGDFVSEAHVAVYEKLARAFPKVTFFGYTHTRLESALGQAVLRLQALDNVHLRESTDPSRPQGTGLLPTAHYEPKPSAQAMRAKFPQGYFFCPEQVGGPKCVDCGLCWSEKTKGLAVVFKKH